MTKHVFVYTNTAAHTYTHTHIHTYMHTHKIYIYAQAHTRAHTRQFILRKEYWVHYLTTTSAQAARQFSSRTLLSQELSYKRVYKRRLRSMCSPHAHVRMHALKGLPCRARVTPASSHASHCSGEALTSPCHACGSASPSRARLCHNSQKR